MRTFIPALTVTFALFFLCACAAVKPTVSTAFASELPAGGDDFRFTYDSADESVVADYKAVLSLHCPRVRRDLQFSGTTHYSVEIYPDQRAYDAGLTDTSVIGSPACSGGGKISLVSPRSPIRVSGISNDQRLKMAVHEYAHLLVNEISPDAPIWLAEGIACYEGSEGAYIEKGGAVSKALPVISFLAIRDNYYDTPAADVYSFLAVRYIIDTYGLDELNRLLRSPGELEGILDVSIPEFEEQWKGYLQDYAE